MALAGELAKYIGGELVKNTGKELATKTAKSALSNLTPKMVAKAGAKATEKSILSSLVPSTARKLASGIELGSEAIPMFRGQMNTLNKLDYNKGLSPNSNGFFMTPNKSATDSWAGKGVVSVDADPNDIMTLDELRSLKKSAEKYFRDPKYQMELYNTNPTQAEIYDALEAGDSYQELSRLTKKPFIERDGGQGTELGEVVFFPDTKPELTSRYNADLASGKNQWLAPTEDAVVSETAVPAGTKISFNKDLSIKSIDEPSRGRGWFADNSNNPHIAQAIKQSGADKYLGEPKVSQSLVELSPEQQEFFKDSVIRDNSGMLKKMYHGSPNGKIKEFNPGSYFTENKEYADGYQNPEASSLMPGARKIKNTPKTYEVYLNIKKPFTLSDAKAKDIYLNEYIKGGNSAYYDPYGTTRKMIDDLDEVDWTEGTNLMEWLQENHPEYDGMYLDEGGTGGYSPDNEYVDRGKSVVNFRGDQVKILN